MKITHNWENDFSPGEYIHTYYTKPFAEDLSLMKFIYNFAKKLTGNERYLEIGGGPTIYQLIPIAKYVAEIHFSDYVDANIKEVEKWLNNKPNQFNWDGFVSAQLKIENKQNATKGEIENRKKQIRDKTIQLLHCDISKQKVIEATDNTIFDVVGMFYVIESITDSKSKWNEYLRNVCSLLGSGGKLIMSSLGDAKCYQLGNKCFPATPVDLIELIDLLIKYGFKKDSIKHKIINTKYRIDKGYSHVFLISGTKE